MRRLALLAAVALLAACEIPTLFERTTYREVQCDVEVFEDQDGDGQPYTAVFGDGSRSSFVADSVRWHGCSDADYEGVVLVPDGRGGWKRR